MVKRNAHYRDGPTDNPVSIVVDRALTLLVKHVVSACQEATRQALLDAIGELAGTRIPKGTTRRRFQRNVIIRAEYAAGADIADLAGRHHLSAGQVRNIVHGRPESA